MELWFCLPSVLGCVYLSLEETCMQGRDGLKEKEKEKRESKYVFIDATESREDDSSITTSNKIPQTMRKKGLYMQTLLLKSEICTTKARENPPTTKMLSNISWKAQR